MKTMKILWTAACLLALAGGAPAARAQMYQTVPADQAQLLQKDPGRLYCPNCGMNLVTFYRTGHALELPDGTVRQYCSLHCLVDEGHEGRALVVDNAGLGFVPAESAFYVVGSDRPGTMTRTSKYAFAAEADATEFALAHGGDVVGYAVARAAAAEAMADDNAMVEQKRALAAEKGRAIFEKMCGRDALPRFDSIAAAKTYVAAGGLCGELSDAQYQAVAIYLVASQQAGEASAAALVVPADAKCPVCGMFVAKYPAWAAMVETPDGRRFWFDGVKDMMKFLQAPERFGVGAVREEITTIRVTDYYTLTGVPAAEAWYVVGSNIYGPMGNELVPFAREEDARTFAADHFGRRVLAFADVTPAVVGTLDD